MIKSIVILTLFFGNSNYTTSQSIKFDDLKDCQDTYEAMKLRYGTTENSWFIDTTTINANLSGCLIVK